MTPITTNVTIEQIDTALRRATHELLTTGVLRIKEIPHIPQPTFKKIMRIIAREHKRPFIHEQYLTVTMSKQKRLSYLVAPWLLIATPYPKPSNWSVTATELSAILTLRFRTEELYMEWFNATQTRPEMRAALRLP